MRISLQFEKYKKPFERYGQNNDSTKFPWLLCLEWIGEGTQEAKAQTAVYKLKDNLGKRFWQLGPQY